MDNKKATVVEELHRPACRNYPRRRAEVRGVDETCQAVPTKTKNGKDVSSAMASILEQGHVPQKLHVDRGKVFYNSEFKKLMKDYGITMYSTFSNLKASISSHNSDETNVTAAHDKYLLRHMYGKLETHRKKKIKFKVGDKVRVSKYKNLFEKGYTPNWTTEIFTIIEVVNTNPVTYKLIDYENKPIEGGFYQEELTKVRYPDVYFVEKILRRRGNKVFVK
ncbi:uncharacterized protein LOC107044793 [Diachasma alloeum]|uniref:uncharacterized protein LOC107044793 n=1 Tax=Diachasma alloeum TaxID=454923 RepID=UPI000738245A|nr:uncharacterized protein LOC107044793 [Diachasma alloeum]